MSDDLRNRTARALFIASNPRNADDLARAWDAPGDHGRQHWWNYADAVMPILAAEKAKWQAEERERIAVAIKSDLRYPAEEWLCAEDAYWRAVEDVARIARQGGSDG